MPYTGVVDPNAGKHFCKVPVGLFKRKWSVWQCPGCGQDWRIEPPRYEDGDSWTFHRYDPTSTAKESLT